MALSAQTYAIGLVKRRTIVRVHYSRVRYSRVLRYSEVVCCSEVHYSGVVRCSEVRCSEVQYSAVVCYNKSAR